MENDPSLVSEFLAGMRRVLSERLVSPLFPAFAISWLGTNYKFVMTIFSDDTLAQKFAVIGTLFPTWQADALQGVVLPSLVALLYILAYPYPARWVYGYALTRQRELLKKRQEIEQARLLTKEESERLRAYYFDEHRKQEAELNKRAELIEQLNAKISALENTRMPEQSQPEDSFPLHPSGSVRYPFATPPAVLNPLERKVLTVLSAIENELSGNGLASESQLQGAIKEVDMTDLRITLENLRRRKLIEGSGGPGYRLTHEGRVAVKEKPSSVPI